MLNIYRVLLTCQWKVKVKVTQSCTTLCNPMDYTVHGILQARILEWVAFPFSRGSSQLRDWTQVSRIAGRFFTSWATGKPKNTEVGSLFLLQQIFPTQESNWDLLHCSWILYQLSYQGRPENSLLLLLLTKSLQLCPTLCDPIDGSPPGSPIPGILQTRTLEWVAISISKRTVWRFLKTRI